MVNSKIYKLHKQRDCDDAWANHGLESTMIKAAKAAGGLKLFDNPSLFLLHLWQTHWLPELWCFINGLQTKDDLDNARIQLNRLQAAINKCITHYHLAMSDYFAKRQTRTNQKSAIAKISKHHFFDMAQERNHGNCR